MISPLSNAEAKYTLFADDTTISVKADTLHQATHLLHEVETVAKHWFAANKLVLNEEKTERIVFSLRDCGAINGELTNIRFLGVTIDPTLKWNVHIDNISTRLTKAIYLLRSLSNCVSQTVLKTSYHAVFHSIMTYGILVWGHSTHVSRLFNLQRKAIRAMAGLGFREDCRKAFKNYNILTLPSHYIFANLMYIKEHEQLYKVHGEVHSYDTRQRNMLTTTYHRLKRCQDGPGYLSAKLFNALPIEIRNLEYSKFKSAVKTFLTINCFYSLDEYFNYKF
ncbi:unnamed protein product [Callosobruchus maculatus]|uniref:Uncharacterized protein n=1 Tax=Callosobruchus maculatus TaxID=64391 RepID=A0A653BLM6_CALMS|nr:unnamed protein product [Callosobruchus maculatus]